MFLPVRTDAPLRHTPWMNWALIAANVLMYLVQGKLWPGQRMSFLLLDPDHIQIFNLFSYQFLHNDVMHLVGNMLFLFIFGNNINDRMGHLGYLAFYLAGGVFAGVGHLLSSTHPVLGASGSVAAVTGAFLVLFPRSHVTVVYFFILIGAFQVWSIYLIGFFFLKDVLLNFSSMGSGVAHMAHIAGTVFGFGVTMGLLLVGLLPRDHFDALALINRWNRRRTYRAQVALGYDPFGYVPRQRDPQVQPSPRELEIIELRGAIAAALAQQRLEDAARLYVQLKVVDPTQVLSRQNQLDVATQLANQELYPQAAEAYESYLRLYAQSDQAKQVQLMLGLIYARYLHQYARAREYLKAAVEAFHGRREADLAREELARIEPHLATQ